MSKVIDAGISTAYGAAVRGGYTGTYEKFCEDLVKLADVLSEFLGFSVTVETLAEGEPATASYDGGILSLGIPRGNTGNGIQSIVLNADYTMTVTYTNGNTWTSGSIRGQVGATPHLTIGTVETLPPSQSASATITGTDENPVLNLSIPKGDTGEVSQSEFDALSDDVNDLTRQLNDETTGLDTKAPVIVNTASGAIATFDDGADSMPVRKLVAQIEPAQNLHGYDHPWPAGGGANKWDEEWELGSINSNGEFYADSSRIRSKNYTAITAETSYYFKSSAGGALFYYDSNKEFISSVTLGSGTVITTPSNAAFFAFYLASSYGTSYKNDTAINYPATVTTYSPYSNECPISGWTGCNIVGTGKNMLNPQTFAGNGRFSYDPETGVFSGSNYPTRRVKLGTFKESTQYTISFKYKGDTTSKSFFSIRYTDGTNSQEKSFGSTSYIPVVFVTDAGKTIDSLNISYEKAIDINIADFQIEEGVTASAYEPFGVTLPITFTDPDSGDPMTVYGGTVALNADGSADVRSNWVKAKINTFSWTKSDTDFYTQRLGNVLDTMFTNPIICSCYPTDSSQSAETPRLRGFAYKRLYISDTRYDTVSDFLAAVGNEEVCYQITTEAPYHIDSVGQLKTFLGTNNVWIDTGAITECDYPADTKLYIDGITAPDEDMIANDVIASGKYFVVNNQLYLSTAAIAKGAQIIPGTNCTATNLAEALNAINA